MTVDFRTVSETAARYALPLCRRWLPNGQQRGTWWLAAVPWREDKHPSLIVSLDTGHWQDRGRGDKGDMIDLYARIYNTSIVEAKQAVAQIVRLSR